MCHVPSTFIFFHYELLFLLHTTLFGKRIDKLGTWHIVCFSVQSHVLVCHVSGAFIFLCKHYIEYLIFVWLKRYLPPAHGTYGYLIISCQFADLLLGPWADLLPPFCKHDDRSIIAPIEYHTTLPRYWGQNPRLFNYFWPSPCFPASTILGQVWYL